MAHLDDNGEDYGDDIVDGNRPQIAVGIPAEVLFDPDDPRLKLAQALRDEMKPYVVSGPNGTPVLTKVSIGLHGQLLDAPGGSVGAGGGAGGGGGTEGNGRSDIWVVPCPPNTFCLGAEITHLELHMFNVQLNIGAQVDGNFDKIKMTSAGIFHATGSTSPSNSICLEITNTNDKDLCAAFVEDVDYSFEEFHRHIGVVKDVHFRVKEFSVKQNGPRHLRHYGVDIEDPAEMARRSLIFEYCAKAESLITPRREQTPGVIRHRVYTMLLCGLRRAMVFDPHKTDDHSIIYGLHFLAHMLGRGLTDPSFTSDIGVTAADFDFMKKIPHDANAILNGLLEDDEEKQEEFLLLAGCLRPVFMPGIGSPTLNLPPFTM